MEDVTLLQAVEKYLRDEMTPEERAYFETLRKTNTEVDQMVVEHSLFLQQLENFSERKEFKATLQHTHTELSDKGDIKPASLEGKAKVVYLWNRYKRVAAIAASIAIVTTLGVSMLVNTVSPKADNSSLQLLGMKVEKLERNDRALNQQLNDVKSSIKSKIGPDAQVKGGGTGFLIDGKGFIITNSHILNNGKTIVVVNNKGEQFLAEILKQDLTKDIAILKIKDKDYKPIVTVPYGFRKSPTRLSEPVYTLGYPKNEIVYSEGYMSARNGFDGDTLTCQLGIAVNDGNSGGPVINSNGEVIGILSKKEINAEGVAFAIQSKYFLNLIEELKKDTSFQHIKVNFKSSVAGLDKGRQVEKIQDCVFMIRSY